jgi:hypothetical protein
MFPSRPPAPLGPGIGPVIIYEESIEDEHFIIDCIKMAHKQRVAERRLHPRRKWLPKKKYGRHRVPRRAVSVDAMDVDRDDIVTYRSSASPRISQSLRNLSVLPAVARTPRTPTAPRPVPEDEEDEEDELAAAQFDRQYRATLEKAQQMQV